MGLKAPIAKDSLIPVTLVFEKAGSIDIELKAEAIGAAAKMH
jgi:copper(I)-binding protein